MPIPRLPLIATLAILITAACAPGPATSQGQAAPSAPAAPKILNLGMVAGEEPKDGGPGYAGGSNATTPIFHTGLTVYNDQAQLQPMLIQRVPTQQNGDWKIAPDGTMEVVWKLRPEARWHDGTPLTAQDVLLGYQAGSDPELFARGTAVTRQVSEVAATDPQTIVMKWKNPYIYANEMSLSTLVPLPTHLLGAAFEAGNKPAFLSNAYFYEDWVGLGPFSLKEWSRGSFMTGQAFDGYFLGRPQIDQIILNFIGDTNTLIVRATAGDVQVIPVGSLKPADALQLKQQWDASGAGTVIYSPSRMRVGRWQLRDPSAPWSDARARQAVLQLIDRQGIVDTIFGGESMVPDILLAQEDPAHRLATQKGLPRLNHDPAAAHRLFAEAGLVRGADGSYRTTAGEPFVIEVGAQSDINSNLQVLQAVADNWRQNGLQPSTVAIPGNLDWREVGSQLKGVYIGGSTPGYGAYDMLLSNQISAPANRWRSPNMGGVVVPAFDDLYNRVLATVDDNQRAQIAADMAKLAIDQMLYLPVHSDDDTSIVAKAVKGVTKVTAMQRVATWNVHAWTLG